jgi:transposase-like protein
MVLAPLHCPTGHSPDVVKPGKTSDGKQRFLGRNSDCAPHTFLTTYIDNGRLPEVKQQVIELAMHGSGSRDPARVLHSSPTTVLDLLTKRTGHPRPQ